MLFQPTPLPFVRLRRWLPAKSLVSETGDVTEPVTAGEASSAILATSITHTEALVSAGSQEDATVGTTVAAAEPVTAGETSSGSLGTSASQTEAIIALGATQTAVLGTSASVAESVAAGESSNAVVANGALVTESVTATETSSALSAHVALIIESAIAGEFSSATAAINATITEPVTATEVFSFPALGLPPKFVSPLLVGIEMPLNQRMVLLISDTLSLTGSVVESATVNESATGLLGTSVTHTEALISVGATQTAASNLNASVVESVNATDSSIAFAGSALAVELVNATDDVSATAAINATITELVDMTDAPDATANYNVSVVESVNAADAVSAGSTNYDVDITESVTAQDTASATTSSSGDHNEILAAIAALQAQMNELMLLVRGIDIGPQIIGGYEPRHRDEKPRKDCDAEKKARIAANNALIMQMVRDVVSKGTLQ